MTRDPEKAHAVVRDIEWSEAVGKIPEPAQRLALGLRLVERCLPVPEGSRWTASVERYLERWWCDGQSRSLITDAAHGIVELLDGPFPMVEGDSEWRARLTPRNPDLSYAIRLDETIRAAPEALNSMTVGVMQTRVAAEMGSRAAAADSWVAFLSELGESFDVLLSRAARQRNAIVHGADTVPEALDSVGGFVETLHSMLIRQQLVAIGTERGLLELLEERNLRLEAQRRRLQAGDSVIESIFSV